MTAVSCFTPHDPLWAAALELPPDRPDLLAQATGTAETLQSLGEQYGIDVRVLDLVGAKPSSRAADEGSSEVSHDTVSSSRIRAALEHGDIRSVQRALDRPYQLILSVPAAELPSDAASGWTLRYGFPGSRPCQACGSSHIRHRL